MTTTRRYNYLAVLDPDHPYYIYRKADDQLLQWCLEGDYAYVFNASQTGKSSLLERTRRELVKDKQIRAATVDLQELGSVTALDEWYRNVARMIAVGLGLHTHVDGWWAAYSSHTPTLRWVTFFEQVVLTEIQQPVVILIDEVDTTRTLPFRDDIYGALRALRNARAKRSELHRLTFVLAGLAMPHELIGDVTETGPNIWKGVPLGDLTENEKEIGKLAEGLGMATAEKRKEVLGWILSWTGGHPYLTQKLCARVQEQEWADCYEQDVDQLVAEEFLNVPDETNLEYVQKALTKKRDGSVSRTALLAEYERILTDGRVRDKNTAVQGELKLTGAVKAEDGWLRIRNRIYEKFFDGQWLRWNFRPSVREWWMFTPSALKRMMLLLTLLLVLLINSTIWALDQQGKARKAAGQARARELAALSYNVERPLDLRLLFAIEALRVTQRVGEPRIVEAEQAIHDVLALQRLNSLLVSFYLTHCCGELEFPNPSPIYFLKIVPNREDLVVTADENNVTSIWSTEISTTDPLKILDVDINPDLLGSPEALFIIDSRFSRIQFSNHGDWLFIEKQYGSAQLQQWETENARPIFLGYKNRTKEVAFSVDDQWLAILRDDGVVQIWQLVGDDAQTKVLRGQSDSISKILFSADHHRLFTGTYDGNIKVWNLDDLNAKPMKLGGPAGVIREMKLLPNERLLTISGGGISSITTDVTVQIWDLAHPDERRVLIRGNYGSVPLALSPDGQWLAMHVIDGIIQLWNLENPRATPLVWMEHSGVYSNLAFSPDGQWLVGVQVSSPAGLRIWNFASLNHKSSLLSVEVQKWLISADSKRLMVLTKSGSVQIWALDNPNDKPAVLRGPQSSLISAMELTADGQQLITGGDDGRPQVWELNLDRLVESACDVAKRNFTQAEWDQYFPNELYRTTCEQWPAGE